MKPIADQEVYIADLVTGKSMVDPEVPHCKPSPQQTEPMSDKIHGRDLATTKPTTAD